MKRSSPLRRYTPLKRGKPPKRGKSPRRVSAKRRKQLEGYPEVRESVLARDVGCVVGKLDPVRCAYSRMMSGIYHTFDPHHVEGRDGGRLKDARKMVALHRPCHEFVHAHQREWRPRLLAYLKALYIRIAIFGE